MRPSALLICWNEVLQRVFGVDADDAFGREAGQRGEETGDLALRAHGRDRARLRQFANDEVSLCERPVAKAHFGRLRQIGAAHKTRAGVVGTEVGGTRHGNVDGDHADLLAVEVLHDRRAEVDVGLELDAEVNLASGKALGVGQSSRPVEPIVGDQQFDAGGFGIALDALFDLDAKADVAL